MKIDTETLKEWLVENLEISVEPVSRHSNSYDVYVGLKFKGAKDAFSYEIVSIPNPEVRF